MTDPFSIEPSPLDIAAKNEADALKAFEVAFTAVDAAQTEAARLQAELDNVLAREKAEAEEGRPTDQLTQRLFAAHAAVRTKAYRIAKLQRDSDEAREHWLDLQKITAQAAYAESNAELVARAADLARVVEQLVLPADAAYRAALADRASKAIMAGRKDHDSDPRNVARVMFSFYCTRLLRKEVYAGGRDAYGRQLESAVDIATQTGVDRFPLIGQ